MHTPYAGQILGPNRDNSVVKPSRLDLSHSFPLVPRYRVILKYLIMEKRTANKKNIAKGTTDPRVEFCLPKFKQVHKFLIKFYL